MALPSSQKNEPHDVFDVCGLAVKDALHNSCEAVVVRIGMGYKAFFAANSTAIGKKNNALDRPSGLCSRALARCDDAAGSCPRG